MPPILLALLAGGVLLSLKPAGATSGDAGAAPPFVLDAGGYSRLNDWEQFKHVTVTSGASFWQLFNGQTAHMQYLFLEWFSVNQSNMNGYQWSTNLCAGLTAADIATPDSQRLVARIGGCVLQNAYLAEKAKGTDMSGVGGLASALKKKGWLLDYNDAAQIGVADSGSGSGHVTAADLLAGAKLGAKLGGALGGGPLGQAAGAVLGSVWGVLSHIF